jgi:hypothetical protein
MPETRDRRITMADGSRPAAPCGTGRFGTRLTALVAAIAAATFAAGQAPSKPKPRPVNVNELRRLDTKMAEIRDGFLRETTGLIRSYELAGQLERAIELLEALAKLDPANEAVRQKLAALRQQLLDEAEFEFEIEPGRSWQPVGSVEHGKILRIRVAGTYSCEASLEAGPAGVPSGDPAEDLVGHVPLGAVMAVIVPKGQQGKDAKPPRPFTIGVDYEKPAERDGVLLLKVNLPPGSKCSGGLTAQISGPAGAR